MISKDCFELYIYYVYILNGICIWMYILFFLYVKVGLSVCGSLYSVFCDFM